MNFKRVLRHPNSSLVFLFLVVIGLLFNLLVTSGISLKIFGVMLSVTGLSLLLWVHYEYEVMFWWSELEWWDDQDGNVEAWQKGNL